MNTTWTRRLLTVGFLGLGIILALAGPAAADDDVAPDRNAFAWIDIKDSHGVPIWKYSLDFDEGGWTSPGKSFWASMIGLAWGLYKIVVLIPLWFLDFVLKMDWIQILASPALLVGEAMQEMVTQFGVTRVLLMVAVMVAGVLVFVGRVATGIYEVCVSMIMAALATGLLAQPVQMVVGPGGWLEQTHRAGLEVSVALSNEANTESMTTDQLREKQMAMLSDVFVAKPYQVVNFGRTLTPECEEKYTEAMREKEFGEPPKARDAIEDCDKPAAEYASNPGNETMFPVWTFLPGAIAVMILATVVAGVVLVAGANAIFQSAKLILALLAGLLPGQARGPVWATSAELIVSLAMVVGTSAFLGAFIVMIDGVFSLGREKNMNPIYVFAVIDIVLIVGVVVFWRWRRQVSRSAGKLAAAMARRPGGGVRPTVREPRRIVPYAAKAAQLGSTLALHRSLGRNGQGPGTQPPSPNPKPKPTPDPGPGPTDRPAPSPRPVIETPQRRELTAGPLKGDPGPNPKGPRPGPDAALVAGRSSKTKNVAGKAMTGVQVGAAALSGGTSAAVTLAAKKAGLAAASKAAGNSVSSARRVSLAGKLGATTSASSSGVHRPTPMSSQQSAKKFERVVKNGRVVLVPSGSE